MSNLEADTLEHFADNLALRIQQLRRQGLLDGEDSLLNLDCAAEAAQAPFQFDMAQARLHRTGCPAIPQSSISTLYAVWAMRSGDEKLACPSCDPVAEQGDKLETDDSTDLFLGLLSIFEQFGSVLRQRGKDYRKSSAGKTVMRQMQEVVGPRPSGNGDVDHIRQANSRHTARMIISL